MNSFTICTAFSTWQYTSAQIFLFVPLCNHRQRYLQFTDEENRARGVAWIRWQLVAEQDPEPKSWDPQPHFLLHRVVSLCVPWSSLFVQHFIHIFSRTVFICETTGSCEQITYYRLGDWIRVCDSKFRASRTTQQKQKPQQAMKETQPLQERPLVIRRGANALASPNVTLSHLLCGLPISWIQPEASWQ